MSPTSTPSKVGQDLIEDLYRSQVEAAPARWRLGPQGRWFVVFDGRLSLVLDFSDEQLLWATQGPEPQAWLRKLGHDQLMKALFRAEIRAETPTEREHDLSPLEARLLSMVSSATEVHYEIAESGVWRFLSPTWTVLTGNELGATLQRPAVGFTHPQDEKKLQTLLDELLVRNAPGRAQVVRFRCRTGEYRDFLMSGEIRGARQGSFPLSVGGTLLDITTSEHARREALAERAGSCEPTCASTTAS